MGDDIDKVQLLHAFKHVRGHDRPESLAAFLVRVAPLAVEVRFALAVVSVIVACKVKDLEVTLARLRELDEEYRRAYLDASA